MQKMINQSIVTDTEICHGQPVFKGTRVMVWQILSMLEEGETEQEIFKAYPNLPKSAIKDALSYATNKVRKVSYFPFANLKPNSDASFLT